jgi:hypothetical protein
MSIDLDVVVAIDVHTHAQVPRQGPADPTTTEILDAAAKSTFTLVATRCSCTLRW